MGSVAISARPVLDTTVVISGKRFRTFSSSVVCRTDSSSDTLGSRQACSAIAPSSSLGTNSAPRNGITARLPASATTATVTVTTRLRMARPRSGS